MHKFFENCGKPSYDMEIKKKILFIAPDNMGKRKGGGLAMKAYYNALKHLFAGMVDVMMPEEYCINEYVDCINVPQRSFMKVLLSGSIHRSRKFLKKYQKKGVFKINKYYEALEEKEEK